MAPKKVTDDEKPKRKIIMTTVELKTELITNGFIQFTLFLMGKFNSKVEQIESRTASWNGLCSTFEGPLYIVLLQSHYAAITLTTSVQRLYPHSTKHAILSKYWLCLPGDGFLVNRNMIEQPP
jgi:hypothetical protein